MGILGLGCALALVAAVPADAATKQPVQRVCGAVLPGFMHCNADRVKHDKAKARAAFVYGYRPSDIQSAYGLTDISDQGYGADQTVAIVDAYDLPTAESDLAYYRSYYGLPACTTANGCFRKVNQTGGTSSYPVHNTNWGGEIALDLDAVSAACPHCHILLVEANSNSTSDLAAAVDTAASLGATQISNSYGGSEFSSETYWESHYHHSGVAVTVSSGDDGYGVEFPAASRYVTAVGGTSLVQDSSTRGWSETAWDGAGSGCSVYEPKPSWQQDTGCLTRSVADVSAVADPNTGIATYDTDFGWEQVGGTSLASPVVAAVFALTGSAASSSGFEYDHTDWFNDVTSGSNGSCLALISYLCGAISGFDGPTGVGTPASAHPTGPPPESGGGSGTGGGSGGGPTPTPTPTPVPVPVPVPVPAQPAVVHSSVAVSSSSVTSSTGGTLKVKLTCGSGPSCSGTLTLQTRLRGTALKRLGKRHFSIRSGRKAWVTVRLTSSNRAYLIRKHTLTVFGTAVDSDGTSAQSSFRLHAPKKPKHRKRH